MSDNTPSPVGRPSKLTPELREKLLDALRTGVPRKFACAKVRIHPSTLCEWMVRARRGEQPYSEFAEDIKQAEAEAVERSVAHITVAAATNWTAAAWFLERRYPQDFGRDKHVITHLQQLIKELEARARDAD